jgi:four helix bundle protein
MGKMAIASYQDLDVWKLAIDLTEDCYRLTASFPRDELFGLSSQIKRAAVSIPANIAEGYGRDQTGGYIQFLRIALGSLRELETHLVITERVKLAPPETLSMPKEKCDRVGRMLRALIRSLEARRSE